MTFRTAYKVWSDKARAAALAKRRGQYTPPAQSQNYDEAIAHANALLAAGAGGKGKAKAGSKGRAKAGGKAKAKAKTPAARTPQEKANQNRASVARSSGVGDLEGTIVRLGAGMHSDLEKDAHDKLISKGLAQRAPDGTVTLTASGKKWRTAADKGDSNAAGEALAEGQAHAATQKDKAEKQTARQAARAQAKAEREQKRAVRSAERQKAARAKAKAKAKKAKAKAKAKATKPPPEPSTKDIAMDLETIADDLAIKAGARHNRSDQDHVQRIHDSAAALGAMCEPAGEAAMKAIADDPIMYAQHECGDVTSAAQALMALAYLAQSELSESDEDEGTIAGLAKAMRLLLDFLDNEIGEIEDAYAQDVQEDQIGINGKAIKMYDGFTEDEIEETLRAILAGDID